METLQNKIDFAMVIAVHHANPNGDPLNGNRPRETYAGYGEISDVCIKRKIRNRMMDMGAAIFVQSDDKNNDGFGSLKERAESIDELKKTGTVLKKLLVKHGWMLEASDRYLHLKEPMFP